MDLKISPIWSLWSIDLVGNAMKLCCCNSVQLTAILYYVITCIQCDYMLDQKVAQNYPKVAKKTPQHIYLKSVLFQNTYAKSTNGNSWKLICYRELSKIVQSGHTFSFVLRLVRDFNFNDVYLPKKDASLMSVVVLQWPQNRAE